VRNRNSIPAGLRELVILRVAVLNRAPYEFDAHVPHALAAGVSAEAVEASRSVPLAADAPFTDEQRVALRLADAMTRDIDVPDALYAEVRQHFNEQGQIDLVATVAAYNMVSRFLVALQIGH
jgi:AhpD family alkylhydroperoxidase